MTGLMHFTQPHPACAPAVHLPSMSFGFAKVALQPVEVLVWRREGCPPGNDKKGGLTKEDPRGEEVRREEREGVTKQRG